MKSYIALMVLGALLVASGLAGAQPIEERRHAAEVLEREGRYQECGDV
jgi:hypothetical protein